MDRFVTPGQVIAAMIGIAALSVLGDYFLKLASQQSSAIFNCWFLLGLVLYASCAFGWVFAMRHMKLAMLGVVFSLATVLWLAGLGVIVFGESLNRYETAGIGLALLSILLLARFSG